MTGVRDWISFWNNPNSIYVNERHFGVHYRDIADAIVKLLPGPNLRVLDYGSGEASHADRVAARAATLYLCESAETVRANLTRRFSGNAKVDIVTPDDVARMSDGSVDMIVANSVVQYLSPAELDRLLALWRRLLTPVGVLIVGDVIPPHTSPVTDTMALLRYAAGNGFLLAAILGLVRIALSDYRAVRNRLGLANYSEDDFLAKLAATGYSAERLANNIEHNPARMTFRARRA
jgi:SAM-dependent methyltransferase